MRKPVFLCLLNAVMAFSLPAAPVLGGVSFFQSSNGNNAGQYWGYPGVEVWIEQNGNWVTTQGGLLNWELQNGENTFNFYVSGNGVVIGTAGLNFQLGSQCRDGISITATSGTGTFSPNGAAGSFWPASGSCGATNAPGRNQTSWTNGFDTVALTSFFYLDHQSSGVNKVFYGGPNPQNAPDSFPDHFGTFTLTVNGSQQTGIPEPATYVLMGTGLVALSLRRRRTS